MGMVPPSHPPPTLGDNIIYDDDLPPLLPVGDDDNEDIYDVDSPPPQVIRVSARGNRGVPATRYDEIFEVAAGFMNPPTVTAAMKEGGVDCSN